VGVIYNMWQWIILEETEHKEQEMQTNILFFLCVWLMPMILLLTMDIRHSQLTSKVANISCTSLERFQRILSRRKSTTGPGQSVVRRLSQSGLALSC
jgi:hypothetical protein